MDDITIGNDKLSPRQPEVGDKVMVDGDEATIIAPGGESQVVSVKIEPVVKTIEEQRDEAWFQLVTGVIRRSKGLRAEEKVELPTGETGHYVKYAYDNQGRFSAGKGHGRRKVRWTSWKADMGRLQNKLFSAGLYGAFKAAQAEAASASTPESKVDPKPITPEKMAQIQTWVVRKAEELTNAPAKAKAKAARKRHRLARRINFGLIPGNSNRSAHSGN